MADYGYKEPTLKEAPRMGGVRPNTSFSSSMHYEGSGRGQMRAKEIRHSDLIDALQHRLEECVEQIKNVDHRKELMIRDLEDAERRRNDLNTDVTLLERAIAVLRRVDECETVEEFPEY